MTDQLEQLLLNTSDGIGTTSGTINATGGLAGGIFYGPTATSPNNSGAVGTALGSTIKATGASWEYAWVPYSSGGAGFTIVAQDFNHSGAWAQYGVNNTVTRIITGIQVFSQFGYGGSIAADAGATLPAFSFQIARDSSQTAVMGVDNVPTTQSIGGDVNFGDTPGSITDGWTGTKWTQWSYVNNDAGGDSRLRWTDTLGVNVQMAGANPGVASWEIRIQSIVMNVYYNDAPSALVKMPGASSNVVNTSTPTVTWTYSDPENDIQQYYRILIFKQSDVNNMTTGVSIPLQYMMNGTDSEGGALPALTAFGATVIYDSGQVASQATSFTVPAGILQNYVEYAVFVLVADQGSNGRSNVIGSGSGLGSSNSPSANQGFNFTVEIEPLLMPGIELALGSSSFDAIHGAIDGLTVQPRVNLLPQVDADLFSGGSGSIGGWVTDTGSPTLGTSTVGSYHCLTLTKNSTLQIGAKSTPVAVIPGQILTGSAKFFTAADFTPNAKTTNVVALNGGTTINIDSNASAFSSLFAIGLTKIVVLGSAGATLCSISGVTGTTSGTLTGVSGGTGNTVNDGTVRVWLYSGLQVIIAYYSDAAGTALIAQTNGPFVMNTSAISTGGNAYRAMAQSRVPQGAVSARLKVIDGCHLASASVAVQMFHPALNCGALNLLDDASLELSQGTILYWNEGTANGGSYAFETTNVGPSYPFSQSALQLNASSTASSTAELFSAYQLHSAYPLDSTRQWASSFDAFALTAAKADTLLGVTALTPNQWQNVSGTFTLAGSSAYVFWCRETAYTAASSYIVDNICMEAVWAFVPFGNPSTMGGSYAASHLPYAPCLCADTFNVPTGNSGATPGGQSWSTPGTNAQAVVTASYYNVSTHQSVLSTIGTASDGANGMGDMEQFFTVSGYSQMSFAFTWGVRNTTATAYLQFYDNAGIPLASLITLGTVTDTTNTAPSAPNPTGGWTTVTTSAVAVPTNAAYARMYFHNPGPVTVPASSAYMWVTDVTMTPTGSLGVSSPWMDGGWSRGMGVGSAPATVTQTAYTEQADSQFELTSQNGFRFVRNPPNAAAIGETWDGYPLSFTDYEYSGGTATIPQTLWYAAYTDDALGDVSAFSQPISITNSASFAPSNWLLIDPLIPADNIILQVKPKVSFSTDENQSVLMPAGRGRKVVVGDTQIFGDTITLDLLTVQHADFVAIKKMYSKVYPLLLRAPTGEVWYVRLTSRKRDLTWTGTYKIGLRNYTLTMEQVDAIA